MSRSGEPVCLGLLVYMHLLFISHVLNVQFPELLVHVVEIVLGGLGSSFPVLVEVAVGSGSQTVLAGPFPKMLQNYNKRQIFPYAP